MISIPLTFSGRVALIAGAGGGIGLNIAHDLLAAGLDVVLADRSIRSNVILPGPVLSPMQARWEGKEKIQQDVAQMIPLGRLGKTQDPANACLFLLSDEASWITGADLTVDGGLSARG